MFTRAQIGKSNGIDTTVRAGIPYVSPTWKWVLGRLKLGGGGMEIETVWTTSRYMERLITVNKFRLGSHFTVL